MNERDYGVGIANRYALFMGEETGDPLTDLMRASKGKENKQQKKVTTAASPVAPTPGSKSASSKNTAAAAGASAAPPATGRTSSGKQGTSGPVPAVGPAAKTQRDGKHQPTAGVTGTQKQPQPQRQQAVAATDQSARVTGREDRVRAERGSAADPKSRPPLREPRAPRVPRDGPDGASGPQTQKDMDERKNRRNRETQDRGPLLTNNLQPDNQGSDERGPRAPRVSGGLRRDRLPVRPAGGRGPRADNRDGRGKPVYDRHSGSEKSGVKAVEKRDGAGAHNWGTMNDEIAAQTDADETQKSENEVSAPVENAENQTAGETETAKEPEEEAPKELTLAEWKALSQRRSQPKYNLRKPNEGVDGAQFKKTYLLQKKKDEEESEYEEIEVITEAKESKKKVLDIEINFNEPFRGGDDRRGGRGGGRGGRGGGGFGRGGGLGGDDRRKRPPVAPGAGSRKQTAPKVDDVNDFPSLGVAA